MLFDLGSVCLGLMSVPKVSRWLKMGETLIVKM